MKTHVIIPAILTLVLVLFLSNNTARASERYHISGWVVAQNSHEAIPYATIALFDSTATTIVGGTISDLSGEFLLDYHGAGNHKLRISAVGFESLVKEIEFNGAPLNLGMISLTEDNVSLQEVVITGQRIKATSSADKTTFFVNGNMKLASASGTDILRLIPGVHFDIRQNISLEGSQNIIILVNGRERDRQYISQLKASQIDKIDVITNPSSQYDASVSGVINIILTDDRKSGLDGHATAEVPVSGSEVYLFPVYSLNYGSGKFNFFTSYNGEISNFNIEETYQRNFTDKNSEVEINSIQYVKQKNWSHRFHFGVDYLIDKKNQLNFYGFFNPFSSEHGGIAELKRQGAEPYLWTASKDDDDKNNSQFYSVFYKHIFNQTSGHEIFADAGIYKMKGKNTIRYTNHSGYEQVNTSSPLQESFYAKVNYSLPISGKLKVITGIHAQQQTLNDSEIESFGYENRVLAFHSSISYTLGAFNIMAGGRYENSVSRLTESKSTNAVLPGIAAGYRFSSSKNLSFNWRQSIIYPGFYQLDPNNSIDDPFTSHSGNPGLEAVRGNNISLEYTGTFGNHYVAGRLFYNNLSGVINTLSLLNEEGILETSRHNLGEISQYGIQITAALALGSKGGFNPYIKVFEVNSTPNHFAQSHNISSRRQTAWATGFSVFYNMPARITASLMFQHASPVNHIQNNYFEEAQYFLSVDKSLGDGFKVGVVSALPFTGQYTYRGSDIEGPDFSNHSTGSIMMSRIPFWLKITYQFSSGSKREKINHQREQMGGDREKGF